MPTSKLTIAVFAAAVALSTAAPGRAAAQTKWRNCPSPTGGRVRFDREGASMDDLYLVAMPPGYHVTTGPAMIAWHADSVAAGDFRIESETFLFDPEGRREAFGFFIGGSDLHGPDQRYTYFLLREGGEFLVKTRAGTGTAEVQGWTSHPAIVAFATKPEGDQTAEEPPVAGGRRRRTELFGQRRTGLDGSARGPVHRRNLRPARQPRPQPACDHHRVGAGGVTTMASRPALAVPSVPALPRLLIGALTAGAAACAAPTSDSAHPLDQAPQIELHPVYRIDDVITGASAEPSDWAIAVLDARNRLFLLRPWLHDVLVLDSLGREAGAMGGQGEGPGEFGVAQRDWPVGRQHRCERSGAGPGPLLRHRRHSHRVSAVDRGAAAFAPGQRVADHGNDAGRLWPQSGPNAPHGHGHGQSPGRRCGARQRGRAAHGDRSRRSGGGHRGVGERSGCGGRPDAQRGGPLPAGAVPAVWPHLCHAGRRGRGDCPGGQQGDRTGRRRCGRRSAPRARYQDRDGGRHRVHHDPRGARSPCDRPRHSPGAGARDRIAPGPRGSFDRELAPGSRTVGAAPALASARVTARGGRRRNDLAAGSRRRRSPSRRSSSRRLRPRPACELDHPRRARHARRHSGPKAVRNRAHLARRHRRHNGSRRPRGAALARYRW